jgi:hypothetical protein
MRHALQAGSNPELASADLPYWGTLGNDCKSPNPDLELNDRFPA